MDYLKTILKEKDIENIYETFTDSVILDLDGNNIQKIILYLESNNITCIYDILSLYTDLLTLSIEEFITKFEKLKNKLGPNFNDMISFDMSLLEQMYY